MLTKHEESIVKDAVLNGLEPQEVLFIITLNRVALSSGLLGFTTQQYLDVRKDVAAFQSKF